MDFSALFPPAPSYFPGLLGEEQARLAQQQAQQQGLLGAALGLMQAGGPSRTPVSFGQSLAQGLQAGQQAYTGALQQRVQEQMIAQQIAEQQRMLKEREAARTILPTLIKDSAAQQSFYGKPSVFPQRDEEGNLLPGAGTIPGKPEVDIGAAMRLLAMAPDVASKVLPTVESFRKMFAPETVTLKPGELVYEKRGGEFVPVAGVTKPEYLYEKLPDGSVVRLDKTGKEPPQLVWTATTAPKLEDAGKVYAQVTFGKTEGLTPDQMAEAFNFQMRPTPRDLMDLAIKAQAVKTDTGVDLMPQVSALGQRVFGATSAVATPVVAPAVATPVAAPSVAPITGAPTAPATAAPAFMQASPQNPMVTNEDVPLKLRNELKAAQPAVLKSSIQAVREIRDLRDTAQSLLNNENGLKSAVGIGGATLSKIPGTPAADAAALLDQLKNRSFTAGILALRQSSPTGSGVGSLTEREGARFENLQASLGQAQSFEQLRQQLRQLIDYSNESLGLLKNAYATDFGPNTTLDEVMKQQVVRPSGTAGTATERLNKIWGR